MDDLRKKYKRGQIDQKTYREKVTELTILHLESINYKYIGKIADGAHGVVVELKSPNSALKVAVKIVIDELVKDGETIYWPKLANEHILSLIKWRHLAETSSKAFFSLKHPATLEEKLKQPSFLSDCNGFEKAVSCINDITNGIHYLHQQGLCHMNLQTDHILMKYNNKARIGSFGYLTSKDKKELKYGTSAIFCPPETHGSNGKIDGQKFDIWSLGIITTEIFTGQHLTKQISKWKIKPSNWYFELYETIFDVLKKDKFLELVKRTFKNSIDISSKTDQVLNFITSCLIFNSADRPSAEDMLNHKLLGGKIEKYYPKQCDDIWSEKVSPIDLLMLGLQYKSQSLMENNAENLNDINKENNVAQLDEMNDKENTAVNPREILTLEDTKELSNDLENENPEISSLTISEGDLQKHSTSFNIDKDEIICKSSDSVISNENIIIQNDSKETTSNAICPEYHTAEENYGNIAIETDDVILNAIDSSDEIIVNNVKEDQPKDNLHTIKVNNGKLEKTHDTNLNNFPKDSNESNSEENVNIHKNTINENICTSVLSDDNKMKNDAIEDKESVADKNISARVNDEHLDKHKFDLVTKDEDSHIDEVHNDTENDYKENLNNGVLNVKDEVNVSHNDIEQEEMPVKQNNSEVIEEGKIPNSISSIPIEQNISYHNTQQGTRKNNLNRKRQTKLRTKHSHKNDNEKSSCVTNMELMSRKTNFKKSVKENMSLPPSVSYVPTNDTDEYELEPGEIPLFRNDYEKILDKAGPDYSVTSLSVFNENYIDFEEGEVDPNNKHSVNSLRAKKGHKCFKNIRSWCKRQKQALTNIFRACVFQKSNFN